MPPARGHMRVVGPNRASIHPELNRNRGGSKQRSIAEQNMSGDAVEIERLADLPGCERDSILGCAIDPPNNVLSVAFAGPPAHDPVRGVPAACVLEWHTLRGEFDSA